MLASRQWEERIHTQQNRFSSSFSSRPKKNPKDQEGKVNTLLSVIRNHAKKRCVYMKITNMAQNNRGILTYLFHICTLLVCSFYPLNPLASILLGQPIFMRTIVLTHEPKPLLPLLMATRLLLIKKSSIHRAHPHSPSNPAIRYKPSLHQFNFRHIRFRYSSRYTTFRFQIRKLDGQIIITLCICVHKQRGKNTLQMLRFILKRCSNPFWFSGFRITSRTL